MNALEVALTILNFTAAEFALAPDVDVTSRIDTLLMSGFEGIAISAPAVAEAGGALPIAVAVRFGGARGWDFPLARNATLVATNLDSGAVLVSDPFRPMEEHKRHMERAPMDRGPRPPADQLEGVSADIAWTDAERAQFEVEPGRWRIALVYHDWVSNSIDVTVAGEIVAPEPQAPWPLPRDQALMPSYVPDATERSDQTVAFDVRVKTINGNQSLAVTGQIRVDLRPWMAFSGTLADQGMVRPVVAAVPVTTIWARQNGAAGVDLRFRVPIYGPVPEPDAPASGAFSLDLLEGAENYRLPAGNYAVWILVDGALYGPQAIEIAENE